MNSLGGRVVSVARRRRHGARHRRGRDRAVPDPGLGRLRAGPAQAAGLDRLHDRGAADRHERDPRRPRHRAAGLRRPGRRRPRPRGARAGPHARRAERLRGALRGRAIVVGRRPRRRRLARAATAAGSGGPSGAARSSSPSASSRSASSALVAFDTPVRVFHELFFPAGSYTFDPLTERLVQLFPFQFWQETAIVVGIVIVAISALVAVVAPPARTAGRGRRRRPRPPHRSRRAG